jgi:hypothetical protein
MSQQAVPEGKERTTPATKKWFLFRPSQPNRNYGGGGSHYTGNKTYGGQNQGGGSYHR